MLSLAMEAGLPERIALERLPSLSTIRRIKAELSEADQVPYIYVRWPDSFEQGLIPWEASRTVLDLIAKHPTVVPPGVRLAQWLWRISLAAPGLSFDEKVNMARSAARVDAMMSGSTRDEMLHSIGDWLTYRGWTAKGQEKYVEKFGEKHLRIWAPLFGKPPLFDSFEELVEHYVLKLLGPV